jgi:hypothetical protein
MTLAKDAPGSASVKCCMNFAGQRTLDRHAVKGTLREGTLREGTLREGTPWEGTPWEETSCRTVC